MISVVDKVIESKAKRIKVYPCYVNRASEIGHPCERYLYYLRANWKQKALYDVDLTFIFEAGNRIEAEAIDEIREAGFLVLEQGRAFEWKDFKITGHLDLKIAEKGSNTAYPAEIKGLQHSDWKSLETVSDFLNSKKVWIQKYPSQLFVYMLLSESEEGLFYIKSKSTHKPKEIWLKLDYEYVEGILQKAIRVNNAVDKQIPPDRIEYNNSVCGRCPFAHICLPEQDFGKGAEMIDSDELEGWLKKRLELEPLAKEYGNLDKLIKNVVKERENIIIGNFWIKGEWQEKKGYEVKPSRFWKVKIIPFKEDSKEVA